MSYDLMVFDAAVAPKDRAGFMAWFKIQTTWGEAHDYNDHSVTTDALKAWFLDIIKHYPPMNGPLASDDIDDYMVTDYSIGKHMIYCGFSWDAAEGAHKMLRDLAVKHGVGFFDVSANKGEILFPDKAGLKIQTGSEDLKEKKDKSLKELILEQCKAVVANDPDWQWLAGKKLYRRRLFPDIDLYISPMWSLRAHRSQAQPKVWVDFKLFTKIRELCGVKLPIPCWSHTYQTYFENDIFPRCVYIYDNQDNITDPTDFSKDSIPDVVNMIYNLGQKIFHDETNFSNEKNFVGSLIETSGEKLDRSYKNWHHVRSLRVECQAILRLLISGDKEFAETALERFDGIAGSIKDNIPKILPHMDDIIAMSPYYDEG